MQLIRLLRKYFGSWEIGCNFTNALAKVAFNFLILLINNGK